MALWLVANGCGEPTGLPVDQLPDLASTPDAEMDAARPVDFQVLPWDFAGIDLAGPTDLPDLGVPVDLTVVDFPRPPDFPPPPDITVAVDLAMRTDLATSPDLAQPRDLAAPLDMVKPPPCAVPLLPSVPWIESRGEAVAVVDLDGDARLDVVGLSPDTKELTAHIGLGNGLFKSAVRYPTTQGCHALKVVDLNGDGFLDVAAACYSPGALNVILGKPNGTFSFSQDYTALGGLPVDVVAGDFNGDGKRDVAAVDSAPGNVAAMEVWLGDGAGGFGGFAMSKVSAAGGQLPKHVTAADFNGDGKLDVALSANSGNAIQVLLGKGDGTFGAASTSTVSAGPWGIASADLNGDRIQDLAVASATDGSASVLLGKGDGTFGNATRYAFKNLPAVNPGSPGGLTIADIDSDGKSDLVVGSSAGNAVFVLAGKGDGTFGPYVKWRGGSNPVEVATGDLDGDGDIDLVTANSAGRNLGVVLAAGKGVPPAVPEWGKAISAGRIVTADFNRDGNPDVAVADNANNGVNLLLGANNGDFAIEKTFSGVTRATALVAGDWNGDGNPDLAAVGADSNVWTNIGNGNGVLQLAVAYEAGPGGTLQGLVLADFDGDKRLDLVTANGAWKSLAFLGGKGDGTFKPVVKSPFAGDFPIDIAAGDFDGDGRLDAALLRSATNDVAVYFGDGTGLFPRSAVFATGTIPLRLLAADLDGDGRIDLATSDAGASTVSVLRNLGMGKFAVAVAQPTGWSPRSITRGDVDGDGMADLVTSNFGGITFLGANGDGTFRPAITYGPSQVGNLGSYIADVVVVDVNRDGRADVVHRTGDLTSIGVMLSSGCR